MATAPRLNDLDLARLDRLAERMKDAAPEHRELAMAAMRRSLELDRQRIDDMLRLMIRDGVKVTVLDQADQGADQVELSDQVAEGATPEQLGEVRRLATLARSMR